MNNPRRDFLKAAGLTLSGAILSSCSTSPNASPPKPGNDGILPNGYRFFRLKGNYDVLPGGLKGQQLRPDAGLDAQGRIIYGAIDSSDHIGMYTLQMGMQDDRPRVLREERLVRTGDALDGRKVVELGAYDINRQGHLALVVKVETETRINTIDEHGRFDGGTAPMRMQSIYCDLGRGLTRVLQEHISNHQGHEFAGMFGDIDLHDDGNLIFSANYYHNDQGRKDVRQGVFLLRGSEGRNAELVVSSGTPLAASAAAPSISHFGLLSLHDGGQFVLQTHLNTPAGVSAQAEGTLQTAVLRGNLSAMGPASSRTGSLGGLQVEASSVTGGLRSMSGKPTGLTIFGPRSGPNNSFAHVLNQGDSSLLFVNNLEVMRSGDRSPSGQVVEDITTPQLAADGVTFFVVSGRAGSELLATNGQQTRSLLKSGDRLVNYPSPVGRSICLGFTATHADDQGRLAFVVDHEDKSQSVVLGLPI
ncbi:MAG: hypothetical protein N2318_04910 [Meiothermus sp.]|nr:hypothetical protein [Meiothermus sp.]